MTLVRIEPQTSIGSRPGRAWAAAVFGRTIETRGGWWMDMGSLAPISESLLVLDFDMIL